MGAAEILKRKSGVIYGKDVYDLFKYAQKHNFAIPAVNVTSSSTVVAALEAARDKKSPIILQMSTGGAAYFCGKGVDNTNHNASIKGAIAGAHFIKGIAPEYGIPVILHTDHCPKKDLPWLDAMLKYEEGNEGYYKTHNEEPLFSSHMIDLSAEPRDENIKTTSDFLSRAKKVGQFLEMEIGITGGEEDGVNNEGVENSSLYTTPEDIWAVYEGLSKVGDWFTVAAAFGNVHGNYGPKGGVILHPNYLKDHQDKVKEEIQKNFKDFKEKAELKDDKPVFLVFHGGSGSKEHEYKTAISHGVVKINLDTDLQYAYLEGIRDYVLKKKDYLMKQVGNPEGKDKPNKKYYDPRNWVREGEVTMKKAIEQALVDFNTANKL